MRAHRLLPVLVLFGCGDNDKRPMNPDAHIDTPPDAVVTATCNYNEAMDTANDNFFGTGNPENTNLTFDGSAPVGICGKIDNGHYDNPNMAVDVDSYTIHVAGKTGAILRLTAPGAENLNTVIIEIYNNTTGQDQTGQFIRDHAAASIDLEPGDYILEVSGFHGSAPAASIDYKLGIYKDDAATRCPKITATANYTESHDGVTADGNDIYEIKFMMGPRISFTNNALDTVEASGITAAAGGRYRISGSSDKPTVTPMDWADAYQDRDTYEITVGADANELSLRLNWSATTADLDFYVFPMNTLSDFAVGFQNSNMEPEFATTAVVPGMKYWVFVGADDATTGQPIAYDLSVCTDSFTAQQ